MFKLKEVENSDIINRDYRKSKVIIACNEHEQGIILFAEGTDIEIEIEELGYDAELLGLLCESGIWVWEGCYQWERSSDYEPDGDYTPVGNFRKATMEEISLLLENKNPFEKGE